MDLFSDRLEHLPLVDADITIYHDVDLGTDYRSLMHLILDNTPWRAETIDLWGQSVLQPRLIAWYGDPGTTYSYSGIQLKPEPWTNTLLDIKRRIATLCGGQFNSVLLNYYRDHKDSMGFHSDDEPELGIRPMIASLSLGEERRFQLKHRHVRELRVVTIPLREGSLLVMRGDTQQNWRHGIPKERLHCGPRVNLTFRSVATSRDKAKSEDSILSIAHVD